MSDSKALRLFWQYSMRLLDRISNSRLARRALRGLARRLKEHLMWTPYVHGPEERLSVADGVELSNCILNTRSGKIVIEGDVIFGHNVSLLTGLHDYRKRAPGRATLEEAGRDIVIEYGAWIASNVTVIGPCIIGRDSVVASGSVVTKNVPAESVVGGIPARVIEKIDFHERI